jgi:hypothetical protein
VHTIPTRRKRAPHSTAIFLYLNIKGRLTNDVKRHSSKAAKHITKNNILFLAKCEFVLQLLSNAGEETLTKIYYLLLTSSNLPPTLLLVLEVTQYKTYDKSCRIIIITSQNKKKAIAFWSNNNNKKCKALSTLFLPNAHQRDE